MRSSHFCTCNDTSCQFNPANHDQGCDLCIEDSLETKEIPKCFFLKVVDNTDDISDWSFESFAKLVLKKQFIIYRKLDGSNCPSFFIASIQIANLFFQ